jgi:Zn-dependent peptidase ImmA (M78 family)
VVFVIWPSTAACLPTNFRTFGDDLVTEPSRNLLDTVHLMARRQAWLREYLMEEGYEPKSFVGSASTSDDVVHVADSIRSTLGLAHDWAEMVRTWEEALSKVFRRVEAAGIMVVRNGVVGNTTARKLDVTEFRGFVLADEYAPVIFINGNDFKAAQMFTLAHELAHIWLGRSGVFDLAYLQPADDAVEKACNRIAAEFLVPTEVLKRHVPQRLQNLDYETVFQGLARNFKVSPLVIAKRVLDMGLINYQFTAKRTA